MSISTASGQRRRAWEVGNALGGAAMDLVLPVRLDERYTTPDEIVTGSATYTNYRRFQTGARLIP